MRFQFEHFVVDSTTRELSAHGSIVPIQPKAVELLLHLLRNRDPMSRSAGACPPCSSNNGKT